MKRGRSTGKPTQAEADRIVRCKSGPCVACELWAQHPDCPQGFRGAYIDDNGGGDYHHLLSGGRRRGHMFGVCLCPWHHRAVLDWGMTHEEMRDLYGPSLAEGSKRFHETFGNDQALLDKQAEILGETHEPA